MTRLAKIVPKYYDVEIIKEYETARCSLHFSINERQTKHFLEILLE